MFFRVAIAIAVIGAALGCGLKIGDKAPKDPPIEVGGKNSACFSKVSERVDKFLAAQLNDSEVHEAISCIRKSFESFARYTRGEDRNSFSPQEIRDFLHEYFVKDRRISDDLLHDFMLIKQAMVGGAVDRVSRMDLAQLVDTLIYLEEQALRLNPYMSDYNFSAIRLKRSGNSELIELDQAVGVLSQVAAGIGQRLAKANSPYRLTQLESFMRNLRSFAGWDEVFQNSRSPASWVKLIGALKAVLTGGEAELINPQDWPVLFSSVSGWYGVYLKTIYAKSQPSLMSGVGLDALVRVGDDVVRLLQIASDSQKDKVISYGEIENLIDSMNTLSLLPKVNSEGEEVSYIRPDSLKKVVRAVFDRVLGDPSIEWRKRKSLGISRSAIAQMSSEFSRWSDIQRLLVRTFNPESGESPGRVVTLAEKLGPLGASQALKGILTGPEGTSAGSVLRMIEQKMRPLFRDGDNQIFLTESSQLARYGVGHGFRNLSVMNLIRGLVGLMMNGYSSYRTGNGPFDQSMSAEELQSFYLDFRDLGVDLKLMDPRSDGAGIRAFREGNLFTYAGNGIVPEKEAKKKVDAQLTFMETMEYTAFIYSGGGLGKSLYQAMMAPGKGACVAASVDAPLSVHGFKMIERKCFRANLADLLIPNLGNMPVMQKMIERFSLNERLAMAENLMGTIYSPIFSNPNFIEWQEITTLAVILHYTEAVMTRYNEDQDEVLNTKEVWNAYETFKGYMKEMAIAKCDRWVSTWSEEERVATKVGQFAENSFGWSDIKEWIKNSIRAKGCTSMPDIVPEAVFAHIVHNGDIPGSLWDMKFFPRNSMMGVDFRVDRSGLLKVFAALVKANAEAARAAAMKLPPE